MPKHPIAVELEAINREGETQVVRDCGLTRAGLQRLPAGGRGQWPCPGHLGR